MLLPERLFNFLKKNKIEFYTGVPDSLLKDFCFYITKKSKKKNHIIAANEGSAISIATGYNLATKKIPLVYLQNSGLGNLINPLVSLTDKNVYSIPMLLMVGWRGEPGTKDEPQHKTQGLITKRLITALNKKYKILNGNEKSDLKKIKSAIEIVKKRNEPVFLLVKKNSFGKTNFIKKKDYSTLEREKAIELIVKIFRKNYKIISTTGKTSRELYEIRKKKKQSIIHDFLTVGSMGHASQIALGIALYTKKKIVCLDGDGSFIMHMGGISTIGNLKLKNFIHIVLNNFAHDSVGGQETTSNTTNFSKIAKACSYKKIFSNIKDENSLKKKLIQAIKSQGPVFMEIIVKKGSRSNLGRPKESPLKNKELFIKNIKK